MPRRRTTGDINSAPSSPPPPSADQLSLSVWGRGIFSSHHLAQYSQRPHLSGFEFGLIVISNAFNRWIVRCMAAAGLPGLSPVEVEILHHIHDLERPKRMTEITQTLNIEDLHIVNYALKKLRTMGVLKAVKKGKEVFYETTDHGKTFIKKYSEIRESLLSAALSVEEDNHLQETARVLHRLSGAYDQAARAATTL